MTVPHASLTRPSSVTSPILVCIVNCQFTPRSFYSDHFGQLRHKLSRFQCVTFEFLMCTQRKNYWGARLVSPLPEQLWPKVPLSIRVRGQGSNPDINNNFHCHMDVLNRLRTFSSLVTPTSLWRQPYQKEGDLLRISWLLGFSWSSLKPNIRKEPIRVHHVELCFRCVHGLTGSGNFIGWAGDVKMPRMVPWQQVQASKAQVFHGVQSQDPGVCRTGSIWSPRWRC